MPGGPLWASVSSVTRQPVTRARCGWETPPRCSRRAGPLWASVSSVTRQPVTKARCGWETPPRCSRRAGPLWASVSSVTRQPATRARCGWETPPRCSRRAVPLWASVSSVTRQPATRARCGWETPLRCSAANTTYQAGWGGGTRCAPRGDYCHLMPAHYLSFIAGASPSEEPHDDRSADRRPACRILSNGAEPTTAAEGGPRGRRRHSGTRPPLLRSHYQRLGVRLVRFPADQLQGGMGWTRHAVDLRRGPRVAAANPRRCAIPAIQRTVQ